MHPVEPFGVVEIIWLRGHATADADIQYKLRFDAVKAAHIEPLKATTWLFGPSLLTTKRSLLETR